RLGAFLARRTVADQRADDSPELGGLLLREVARLEAHHVSFLVLADEKEVDQPDDVVLTQPLEFLPDAGVGLGIGEPDDEQLNWSECHHCLPWVRSAAEQLLLGLFEFLRRQCALVRERLQLRELRRDVAPTRGCGCWGRGRSRRLLLSLEVLD